MKSLFRTIWASFSQIWGKSEDISLSGIRPARLHYVLAYAFELILYSVRGHFIPVRASFMGIPGKTIIYVAHILASLVIMLLWSERFKPLVRASVIVMLAGFLPFLFLPYGYTRLIFGVVAYMGLGGVVTSARCGYAFAANNAERLIGIAFMYFSIAIVKFVDSRGIDGVFVTQILPILLLAAISACLLLFREEDLEAKCEETKGDERGLYWAFVYFIAYFAIDGYLWGLVDNEFQHEYNFLLIGMIASGAILLVMLAWLKLHAWHVWNVFFLFVIAMAAFAILSPQIGSMKPQYLFCGLSLIGWPLCIYMLGCTQRRFASYRLLKKCTVIFVLLSPLTTISDDLVEAYFPEAMPAVTLVLVLAIVVALLILSPYSYKNLFSVGWISDIHKNDMSLLWEKVGKANRLEGFGLTHRQMEVATLLLAAKTRRQISGELGISESTVKTHTADLYRKLNINSRVELFRLFGVAEIACTPEDDQN